MHPPLDRPHPDCQDAIRELRDCHANNSWSKYLGACNAAAFHLDRCLKAEKQRVLDELNRDLDDRKRRQEEIIKVAFGKDVTFSEYLQQDREYQREVKRKEQAQTQR